MDSSQVASSMPLSAARNRKAFSFVSTATFEHEPSVVLDLLPGAWRSALPARMP